MVILGGWVFLISEVALCSHAPPDGRPGVEAGRDEVRGDARAREGVGQDVREGVRRHRRLGLGSAPPPYTLHPGPYTLHLAPYNLHPPPSTLHPTSHCTLPPSIYTLHPTPYTLHPPHFTLHTALYTLHFTP